MKDTNKRGHANLIEVFQYSHVCSHTLQAKSLETLLKKYVLLMYKDIFMNELGNLLIHLFEKQSNNNYNNIFTVYLDITVKKKNAKEIN